MHLGTVCICKSPGDVPCRRRIPDPDDVDAAVAWDTVARQARRIATQTTRRGVDDRTTAGLSELAQLQDVAVSVQAEVVSTGGPVVTDPPEGLDRNPVIGVRRAAVGRRRIGDIHEVDEHVSGRVIPSSDAGTGPRTVWTLVIARWGGHRRLACLGAAA